MFRKPVGFFVFLIIISHLTAGAQLKLADRLFLDSLERTKNEFSLMRFIITGQTLHSADKRTVYSYVPLLESLSFNTVEGLMAKGEVTITRLFDSTASYSKALFVTPVIRYGFNNHHLNAALTAGYRYGKKNVNTVIVSGGKNVFQFNSTKPIMEFSNATSTLLFENNYMKIYEAWYGNISYNRTIGKKLAVVITAQYEDRMPLENTTLARWIDFGNTAFTPNYPTELVNRNIVRHQATTAAIGIVWQPEMQKVVNKSRLLNSRLPIIDISYTKGIDGLLGSDVDFDRWRLGISSDLKIGRSDLLSYRLVLGGFLNNNEVEIPDYQHFFANRQFTAAPYLYSFQVAPYYFNSTKSFFFSSLFLEYHLREDLLYSVPLIGPLRWRLVAGTNSFAEKNKNYIEVFGGIENIFRYFRIDYVQGFLNGNGSYHGFVLGIRGITRNFYP